MFSEGNWKVYIKTSDREDAGTVAKATITCYGDKGSSDSKSLECKGFEANSEKDFEVSFVFNNLVFAVYCAKCGAMSSYEDVGPSLLFHL